MLRLMDRLYDMLCTTAANGKTVTYTKVAKSIGMRPVCIWPLLDDINRHEASQGRGRLLSAVVVGKNRKFPGDGFFLVARELGHDALYPRESDRKELREFWKAELARVHKFYSRHDC